METIIKILGYLLYLNYRLIYSVFIHKTVYSFKEWSERKDTDNSISVIFTIDLIVLAFYFMNFLLALTILTIVFTLNIIVVTVYNIIKKRRNESK